MAWAGGLVRSGRQRPPRRASNSSRIDPVRAGRPPTPGRACRPSSRRARSAHRRSRGGRRAAPRRHLVPDGDPGSGDPRPCRPAPPTGPGACPGSRRARSARPRTSGRCRARARGRSSCSTSQASAARARPYRRRGCHRSARAAPGRRCRRPSASRVGDPDVSYATRTRTTRAELERDRAQVGELPVADRVAVAPARQRGLLVLARGRGVTGGGRGTRLEVGEDVVDVLDADREPHQPGRDAGGELLLGGELASAWSTPGGSPGCGRRRCSPRGCAARAPRRTSCRPRRRPRSRRRAPRRRPAARTSGRARATGSTPGPRSSTLSTSSRASSHSRHRQRVGRRAARCAG